MQKIFTLSWGNTALILILTLILAGCAIGNAPPIPVSGESFPTITLIPTKTLIPTVTPIPHRPISVHTPLPLAGVLPSTVSRPANSVKPGPTQTQEATLVLPAEPVT